MQTILCAIDFSSVSPRVVQTGIRLAAAFDARLLAFHAVHFATDPLYGTDLAERRDRARRQAATAARRLEAIMADAGVSWEPVVVHGDPVEQIADWSSRRPVDLVVAASQGIGGLQRLLWGTVVERMAKRIPVPMLIIRPSRTPAEKAGCPPFDRILAGCELHGMRDEALYAARRLAERLGAELHLLHAIERPLDDALVDPEQGPYTAVQQSLQGRLHLQLMQACPGGGQRRLRIKTAVAPGHPADALERYARGRDIDLLAVGVHREEAFRTALIGATARRLLRRATCSLLIVPEARWGREAAS